jgi:DNA repair photolyase
VRHLQTNFFLPDRWIANSTYGSSADNFSFPYYSKDGFTRGTDAGIRAGWEITMPLKDSSPRPASSALTPTSGFLTGYTHTLNPYTGCAFKCEYCYVREMTVHRFHKPKLPWGAYAHPRLGINRSLEREMIRHASTGRLAGLAVFMSSVTDPYQALERQYRLSHSCLEVMTRHTPGLLTVQTRSPYVADDFELMTAMGECCWLNFTLETDRDDVRRAVTPYAPSIHARLATLRAARLAGVNVQITVSPCLPYSSLENFGGILLEHADRVIVDSYTAGDGLRGSRTAATAIPDIYSQLGWGPWQSTQEARALYQWLEARLGDRVSWSQQGFRMQALLVTGFKETALEGGNC